MAGHERRSAHDCLVSGRLSGGLARDCISVQRLETRLMVSEHLHSSLPSASNRCRCDMTQERGRWLYVLSKAPVPFHGCFGLYALLSNSMTSNVELDGTESSFAAHRNTARKTTTQHFKPADQDIPTATPLRRHPQWPPSAASQPLSPSDSANPASAPAKPHPPPSPVQSHVRKPPVMRRQDRRSPQQ